MFACELKILEWKKVNKSFCGRTTEDKPLERIQLNSSAIFLVGLLFFSSFNIIQIFLNEASRTPSTNLFIFLSENSCRNCILVWKSINSNKISLWIDLRRLFWWTCNGEECSDASTSVQPFLYPLKLLRVYEVKHENCNDSFHFLWKIRFQTKTIITLFQTLIPN